MPLLIHKPCLAREPEIYCAMMFIVMGQRAILLTALLVQHITVYTLKMLVLDVQVRRVSLHRLLLCFMLSSLTNLQSGFCDEGKVSLVGGSGALSGIVEVCYNGVRGAVCADSWGPSDAQVVCSQLGYSTSGYHTTLWHKP